MTQQSAHCSHQESEELILYLNELKQDSYTIMNGEIVDENDDYEPQPLPAFSIYCHTCGTTLSYPEPEHAPCWAQELYQKVRAYAYRTEEEGKKE